MWIRVQNTKEPLTILGQVRRPAAKQRDVFMPMTSKHSVQIGIPSRMTLLVPWLMSAAGIGASEVLVAHEPAAGLIAISLAMRCGRIQTDSKYTVREN